MFASSLLRSRLCLEEKQRPSSLSIVTCYVDFLKTEDFFNLFLKRKLVTPLAYSTFLYTVAMRRGEDCACGPPKSR